MSKKTEQGVFYLPEAEFLLWAKFKIVAEPTSSKMLRNFIRKVVQDYERKHGPIRVNSLGPETLPEEVPASVTS